MSQTTTIFGIRHHGPGSARSLVRSLQALNPDILLIEGPPEANNIISLVADETTSPPIALLLYPPDHLQQAVYYPFAAFSPEWQAIQHGLKNNLPVRFMDLPQAHQMAERITPKANTNEASTNKTNTNKANTNNDEEPSSDNDAVPSPHSSHRPLDPLSLIATAAGYTDSERWWEHMVEQRQDNTELFAAILEAMSALRSDQEQTHPPTLNNPAHRREMLREAHMRQTIRQAQKEGFQTIAVVCGAWHSPALHASISTPFPKQREDNALLKGLPKVKVNATWIPWTYARLSNQNGYGAGISSPGWYAHLWESSRTDKSTTESAISWLTRVARLLRKEDLAASSASVIEAVRLAEALAALRDSAMPGLEELNEATQTVLCFGDDTPLKLIHQQLIVSDRIGTVPSNTPLIPLQQNLQQQQKKYRLKPEASEKLITLDLRKELDLARSHLLHRLRLLGIDWGIPKTTSGKGTFKEAWRLCWEPELSVAVVEAGRWGNTLMDAATAYVYSKANEANQLNELTHLLDRLLLADLPGAIAHLMQQLQNMATLDSDVTHLMAALPSLVNILRYRDVRQTDSSAVIEVVDGIVARVCIGLPGACASLDDEAASGMMDAIAQTHSAIKRLNNTEHSQHWSAVLQQLCDQQTLHGLISGRSCRFLLDEGTLATDEAARRLSLALSLANEPTQAAAWVEGFLRGSGLLLLHDDNIWNVLDSWMVTLSDDAFTILLPLLRRTFSNFPAPERRQMGEKVRAGDTSKYPTETNNHFDHARAETSLPLIKQLIGLTQ
ncbi:MAG: DUF5682 family protein [Cyanobacteria bacterium J06573_11]